MEKEEDKERKLNGVRERGRGGKEREKTDLDPRQQSRFHHQEH